MTETPEQIAARILPSNASTTVNQDWAAERYRSAVAAALQSERDSRDSLQAEVERACEALFSAYRARYLTPSTDRMRSNAPFLREMGELKLAVQALTAGEK